MAFPACMAVQNTGLHPSQSHTMETRFLLLAFITVAMIGVTYYARRIGNERRDFALLAVFAGLFTAGTAVGAVI